MSVIKLKLFVLMAKILVCSPLLSVLVHGKTCCLMVCVEILIMLYYYK